MSIRKVIKSITSLSLVASLLLISSCSKKADEFPQINIDETSEIVENTDSTEPANEISFYDSYHELSVALPYSEETINRLIRLFYIEKTSLLPRTVTGRDISLDYLDGIDVPYVINSVSIPDEGLGIDTLSRMNESGNVPDVFMTFDIDSVIDNNLSATVDDYLGNLVFDNSGICVNALLENQDGGKTYGLPMYQSVMLLVGSSEYIPNGTQLPFRATTNELRSYLLSMNSDSEEETVVIPFVGADEMIPYIMTAVNDDVRTSYMCEDEQDSQVVTQAVYYINSLYNSGVSTDINEDGSDPRVARNAGMWLESSANISRWAEYYPNGLYFCSIPSSSADSELIPYASVYSMCVSKSCDDPEFAAEFISYICFDEDAQLLLQRIDPKCGYLPIMRSQALWDMVCSDSVFGNQAAFYKDYIVNSVYCPALGSIRQEEVRDYCVQYENNLNTEEEYTFDSEALWQ